MREDRATEGIRAVGAPVARDVSDHHVIPFVRHGPGRLAVVRAAFEHDRLSSHNLELYAAVGNATVNPTVFAH